MVFYSNFSNAFGLQDLEPAVTIDTVPNVKKKHEVNVGMYLISHNLIKIPRLQRREDVM